MRRFAAVAIACLTATAARGDDPFARGIDAVPIKLTPTMDSGLSLDGAELRERKSFQLRAVLDANIGVLGLKLGNQYLGNLLPFRTDLHLLAAYQVHPRVELAADLPITVVNISNFNLLNEQGFQQASPRAIGLGAPRLLARLQIIKQEELPIVALAAIAEVRAPIGDGFSFMSDRGLVFAPRLAAERRFGPVRALFNIGWRFRTAPGQYLNLYVGHEFAMGGGAIVDLPDVGKLQQLELLGELNLATPAEAPFTFRDSESLKTPLELMVGARAMLDEHWGVEFGVAKGLGSTGYGRETFRVFIGGRYDDRELRDTDGDGIPDIYDQCPDLPENKNGIQDDDGCPEPEELDTDHDGVPDRIDACPTQPGPAQLDGCPDRDGDQIPDNVDKCPDQPGTPELNGCPPPEEEAPVVLESQRIRINNQIQFEFGSAKIDPRSFPMLDEVAKVLTEHPEVGPVLIEGHTDNIGTRPYNLNLSKRRAKAVSDYLITKSIDPKRLRSDGFGFDRPIAPNDTPLDRAKNRRTEFRLLEKDDQQSPPPSGAPTGATTKPAPMPAPPAPKPALEPKRPAPPPAPAVAPRPAPPATPKAAVHDGGTK